MNQNIKIGLAALVGFTVAFAFTKILTASKNDLTPEHESPEKKQPSTNEAEKVTSEHDDSFPLQLGSSGARVERLQVFLMRNLGWVRKPNGVFDLLTQERTQKYFKENMISQELYEKLMLDKMIHDQRIKKAS